MSAAPQTCPTAPVVTAMSVLTPLADTVAGFLDGLLHGRSAVTLDPGPAGCPAEDRPVPAARLSDFRVGDWANAQLGDQSQGAERLRQLVSRLPLPVRTAGCVAVRALIDAGLLDDDLQPQGFDGSRTGLLVAGSNLTLAHTAETVLGHANRPGRLRASYALTHLDIDVVGAVSELTGITGEGWTVGGASASGTLALIQAARAVRTTDLDRVLVVAPAVELSPVEIEAFRRTGALAHQHFRAEPDRMCRPFDSRRQGFVRGEAAAAVLVESAACAAERGAEVLAVLAGHGQRLDARRGTDPSAAGEAAAIRAALESAGLAPADVDYVNAHATGSVAGDAAEAAALREVFGTGRAPLVNSTKALTGHCLSAAGVVEAVATIAQLRAGICHPNPNLDEPIDAGLALAGPVAVPGQYRTAVSNSVAFGGINAALVLRLPAEARTSLATEQAGPPVTDHIREHA